MSNYTAHICMARFTWSHPAKKDHPRVHLGFSKKGIPRIVYALSCRGRRAGLTLSSCLGSCLNSGKAIQLLCDSVSSPGTWRSGKRISIFTSLPSSHVLGFYERLSILSLSSIVFAPLAECYLRYSFILENIMGHQSLTPVLGGIRDTLGNVSSSLESAEVLGGQ